MPAIKRAIVQVSLIALLSTAGLGLALTSLAAAPVQARAAAAAVPGPAQVALTANDTDPPLFPPNPLITPTGGVTVANPLPTFDWKDADDGAGTGVVSYTLLITGSGAFSSLLGQVATATITTSASIYTPGQFLPNGSYTWTVRAHDAAGNASPYVTPETFALQADLRQVYLPLILRPEPAPACPTTSGASFALIPFEGAPADHPDYLHGDLNLALRSYAPTSAFLGLVDYSGGVDPNAPRLHGLFEPNRIPTISAVYRVYQWLWDPNQCGGNPDGCRGPIDESWPVTVAGFATTAGEAIYPPERGPEIFGGGYIALVLYAEETRITLAYTRRDTVATGYAVHLENICVDPNLLALYRAQRDANGWHVTGQLPALRNNQALGTAPSGGGEIRAAIRDNGAFMDPRSRKDWWQGLP